MNWTAAQIAEACAGEIRGDENARASAISTDTRALNPGDAFLALRGENFDGHDYLDRAVEAGASILIVDTPGKAPENVTSVIVKDTLRAWGELAAFYRDRFSARRIGIVGSSGKTTVKDMLAAILRDAAGEDAVLATEANYNNLVGVPKNIFRLNANHQYAVLEMGMNVPGELARLARIADPELLVFLNVGTAHIGMFDSLDGLLAAKAEAVENLSESARVLYDADSEHTCTIMRDKAKTAPENRKTFALDNPADYRAINIQAFHDSEARQEWGYQFEIDFQGEKHKARLPMFGRHNVRNALAAAAAVHLMGIDAATATEALAKLRPSPMRSEVRAAGDSCLIVDCYNANPDSMRSGIESLEDWKGNVGQIHLVLGEMLELGPTSKKAHAGLKASIEKIQPQTVSLYGEEMAALFDVLKKEGDMVVLHHHNHEALADALLNHIEAEDLIFFKGSRGCRLENIVMMVQGNLDQRKNREKA